MTDYINVDSVTDKHVCRRGANDLDYWHRGYLSHLVSAGNQGIT